MQLLQYYEHNNTKLVNVFETLHSYLVPTIYFDVLYAYELLVFRVIFLNYRILSRYLSYLYLQK